MDQAINTDNLLTGKFKKIKYGGQEILLDSLSNQIQFSSGINVDNVYIDTITKDSNINLHRFQQFQTFLEMLEQQVQSNLQLIFEIQSVNDRQQYQLNCNITDIQLLFHLYDIIQQYINDLQIKQLQQNQQINSNSTGYSLHSIILTDLQEQININKNNIADILSNSQTIPGLVKDILQLGGSILLLQNQKLNIYEYEMLSRQLENQILTLQNDIVDHSLQINTNISNISDCYSSINSIQSDINGLQSQQTGNWISDGQLIALEVIVSGHTASIASISTGLAAVQGQVTALEIQLGSDKLIGDIADKVSDTISSTVTNVISNTFWGKVGQFFKDNWLAVIGTLFSGSISSLSLDKADRLFQVLTVDNQDLDGLYYVEISQNIKMPQHDITAQSIHGVVGQIDNYDLLFQNNIQRLDVISDSIRIILGIDIDDVVGKQGSLDDIVLTMDDVVQMIQDQQHEQIIQHGELQINMDLMRNVYEQNNIRVDDEIIRIDDKFIILDQNIDLVDIKVDVIDDKIDDEIIRIDNKIDDEIIRIDNKIDDEIIRIDGRIDTANDNLNVELSIIQNQLNNHNRLINNGINNLNNKITAVDGRVDEVFLQHTYLSYNLNNKITALTQQIEDLQAQINALTP